MDFKKNLYWIVLGAVVLLALVAYPMFVTDVEATASEQKNKCDAKVHEVHKLASEADKPDAIKTEAHVTKAKEYRQKVEGQIKDIAAEIKKWTVNTNFDETPPAQVIPFDDWLSKRRDAMYAHLRDAKISFPDQKFDKLTFKDDHTMDVSTSASAQRPYRMRRMAIVEDVIGTLLKVHSQEDVTDVKQIGADPWWNESTKAIQTGVVKIDALNIMDPAESMKLALERENDALYTRSGRTASHNASAPHFGSLPYQISTVEVDFEAPLVCVPAVVKALENSEKYHAVITKLDVTRATFPYPGATDVAKAGPDNALVNSYYREGPVKAAISFDIYEYDPSKAAEFERELNGAPAAAAPATTARHH